MEKGFGGNMGNLLKQAQEVQSKLAQIQESLGNRTVEASSGGGMVRVIFNGRMELSSIKVDPSVIDPQDTDMLEDLLRAAVNDGLRRVRDMVSAEMNKATGGIKIPGLTI